MTEVLEDSRNRRRAIIMGAMTAAHFLVFVAVLLLMLAASSSRFDGGGPPDASYLVLKGAFQVLSLPLAMPLLMIDIPGTGPWGWLIFLANSAVWGWAGWRLVRYRRAR